MATTVAANSPSFLGQMASLFTGATADGASALADFHRPRVKLKDRLKLEYQPEDGRQVTANFQRTELTKINESQGRSESGNLIAAPDQIAKLTGGRYTGKMAANDAQFTPGRADASLKAQMSQGMGRIGMRA